MERVTAQVVLRAPDGGSVLDADPGVAEGSLPAPETLEDAAARLDALGFEVGERGGATLTVSGDRGLFERVFSVRLEWLEEPGSGGPAWTPMNPPTVPEELADVAAGVVFSIPPIPLP